MILSLKTSIWAPALIRRAQVAGAYASVIYKGDPDAGAALIKVRTLDGLATLYSPMRDMAGDRRWLPKGALEEQEIDDLVSARLKSDPDLWVIEIEDREGRHFITEAVERL